MRRAAAALILALAGAACGGYGDTEGAPVAATEDHAGGGGANAEAIALATSLAEIRGHHLVSLELYEGGDAEAALLHAGHPVEELLASVQPEVAEHDEDLAAELAERLAAAPTAIEDGASPEELSSLYDEIGDLTADAEAAVAGDAADDPAFRGSVIAALLATAAHEYEEAVAGGKGEIRLVDEYHDAYGFVQEAKRLYEDVEADVAEASAEEAEEVEEAFAKLDEALPSPEPPADPAPASDVEAAAELIGHELEETVGAEPVEASDPEAVGEEISGLLDEIVAEYEAGNAAEAAELAAEAYLENYEVIEAQVIEAAPEINEELEPLLGAELRKQIQSGASVAEIRSMVDEVRELLDQALEALEH